MILTFFNRKKALDRIREDVLASAAPLPKKLLRPPPLFLLISYTFEHRSERVLAASGIAIAPPPLIVSTSPSLTPMPSEPPRWCRSNQPKQDDSSSNSSSKDAGEREHLANPSTNDGSSSSEDTGEHEHPTANPMPRKKSAANAAVDSSSSSNDDDDDDDVTTRVSHKNQSGDDDHMTTPIPVSRKDQPSVSAKDDNDNDNDSNVPTPTPSIVHANAGPAKSDASIFRDPKATALPALSP